MRLVFDVETTGLLPRSQKNGPPIPISDYPHVLQLSYAVYDITQKKVWRVHEQGKKVNWNNVDPEPHAVVLWGHNEGTIEIPFSELEVISET